MENVPVGQREVFHAGVVLALELYQNVYKCVNELFVLLCGPKLRPSRIVKLS